MAETPPVDAVPIEPTPEPVTVPLQGVQYDGENAHDVLGFMRSTNPDNPPIRGGVRLQPEAPGEPLTMTVELADGTTHEIIQGDALKFDGILSVVAEKDISPDLATVIATGLELPE